MSKVKPLKKALKKQEKEILDLEEQLQAAVIMGEESVSDLMKQNDQLQSNLDKAEAELKILKTQHKTRDPSSNQPQNKITKAKVTSVETMQKANTFMTQQILDFQKQSEKNLNVLHD